MVEVYSLNKDRGGHLIEQKQDEVTAIRPKITAHLYVCPKCGFSHGGSSMPDLSQQMNYTVNSFKPKYSRDLCPMCITRGIETVRVRYKVTGIIEDPVG